MSTTIESMDSHSYDLWYDANAVGADLVVDCWISHSPRAGDDAFAPVAGDLVTVGDDEESPLAARVLRREGDRVRVQIQLSTGASAVA